MSDERASGRAEARAVLNMYSPLSALVRREPVTVPLEASLREALLAMEQARASALVVADAGTRYPLGIFTRGDLLRRVVLAGEPLDQPVAAVMTSGLLTLLPTSTVHHAALAMAQHGVRHVVLVDAERRLVGIVEQDEVFALQGAGVKEISEELHRATDVAGVRRAADRIRKLADALLAQGTSAETLTQFMTTLNDLLTLRIIEQTLDEFDLPTVRLCWMAVGSEGRLEQTFDTDQDNGIIFEAPEADADRVRAALLPFARAVNQKLAECGFPLCKGNIMAGNPEWCLTTQEWQRRFAEWIYRPDGQALLNAAIFFDFRPIYGHEELALKLRDWVLGVARDQPLFLRLLADNALHCQPAMGTIREFVYDDTKRFPHTIDLKMHGSRPYVDAARIFCLANGVPFTSTAQRLRAVSQVFDFGTDGLAAIIDGFYFIHRLRLRVQGTPGTATGAMNRVDPDVLNELDRHVLREAFRQARRLQHRLALDYRLDA